MSTIKTRSFVPLLGKAHPRIAKGWSLAQKSRGWAGVLRADLELSPVLQDAAKIAA